MWAFNPWLLEYSLDLGHAWQVTGAVTGAARVILTIVFLKVRDQITLRLASSAVDCY